MESSLLPRQENARPIRVAVLGATAAGKSSLVSRFVGCCFSDHYEETKEVTDTFYVVKLDNKFTRMQLFDVPGTKERQLSQTLFRVVDAVIVAFDVTRKNSLAKADAWLKLVRMAQPRETMPVVLVGTKTDQDRASGVDFPMAKTFADRYNVQYMETSAKCNRNIDDMFFRLVVQCKKLAALEFTPMVDVPQVMAPSGPAQLAAQYRDFDMLETSKLTNLSMNVANDRSQTSVTSDEFTSIVKGVGDLEDKGLLTEDEAGRLQAMANPRADEKDRESLRQVWFGNNHRADEKLANALKRIVTM